MKFSYYFVSMNIQERKYSIIEKILFLDENQLDRIESLLSDDVELIKALDNALIQVKEGKVSSHTEVRKKYEKWL